MYFNRCYKGSISVIEHSLLRKTFSTVRLIILASTLPRQGIMHIIKTKNSTITTKKPFQFKKLSLKSNHTNLLLSILWLNHPLFSGKYIVIVLNVQQYNFIRNTICSWSFYHVSLALKSQLSTANQDQVAVRVQRSTNQNCHVQFMMTVTNQVSAVLSTGPLAAIPLCDGPFIRTIKRSAVHR